MEAKPVTQEQSNIRAHIKQMLARLTEHLRKRKTAA